ncbi:hypothetical protein BJ875DRAFT_436726 [Amylocarpus encephaloides]|uniref:SAP domain-containing protein n=1 Tax=Amylocarpus encephaloides TaxID=45428 RepID=A0A9P7YUG6_9HELO|nr:hypothetical protein BJ875DRAFT_436726 [Amylocarpus encephaloides]
MADYNALKVPDLKKVLQERGLVISGNKADLIARLQEHDKKGGGGAGGEDEIDWDEDDTKATAAPAVAAVAAGGQVANPTAIPNQEEVDTVPSTTKDLKVASEGEPKSTEAASTDAPKTEAPPVAEPEAPKHDFTAGIQQSDADKEAEKRAARAKRFGMSEDDEANKLADRAKKFGLDNQTERVKGLDSALPERRAKRTREDRQGGRNAKRQTPDGRTGPAPKQAPANKKAPGKVVDDPAEKAKAEARAKRFQNAN